MHTNGIVPVIAIWLRASLIRNRRYPILLPELDDLQEMSVMLANRIGQWAEQYIATGREEGREEGRERGRLEGEVRMLARQLTRRFGPLPAWVEERLANATEVDLENWIDAVLTAKSLAEVFAEHSAGH